MNRKQRIFAVCVILAGVAATLWCLSQAFPTLAVYQGFETYVKWGTLLLLMVVFRSLALDGGRGVIDFSFAPALCARFLVGAPIAILLYALSTVLCEARDPDRGEYHNLWFFQKTAVLFNTFGMILALFLADALVVQLQGGIQIDTPLDQWTIPLLFTLFTLAVLISVTSLMDRLERRNRSRGVSTNPLDQIPSVVISCALGLGMWWMFLQPAGRDLLLIGVLPLTAMRYAFALWQENGRSFRDLMDQLVEGMEAGDPYLKGHAKRVENYAAQIGIGMRMPAGRVDALRTAALIHDIGDAMIPATLFEKEGTLTPGELEIMQSHPQRGAALLTGQKVPELLRQVVLHHHERYDGNGYPDGIKLSELPVEVSIVSAAEAFDAMTSDRAFRKAMSPRKAMSVMVEESGRQFHPEVVYTLEQRAGRLHIAQHLPDRTGSSHPAE